MQLIESQTITSTVSSVTFSSIPNTFRDLILVINKPSGDFRVSLRFNNDSGTNYVGLSLQNAGNSVARYNSNQNYIWSPLFNSGGNAANLTVFQIMDYSRTDKHKTVLSKSSIPTSVVSMESWRWANLSAINSIYVEPDLTTGSTLSLYGITA